MVAFTTFDTLKFAQSLIDAGFSEQQAKALTKNQKEILDESITNTLATKSDIQEIKSELTLLKYMLGLLIGMMMTLVVKFIFN